MDPRLKKIIFIQPDPTDANTVMFQAPDAESANTIYKNIKAQLPLLLYKQYESFFDYAIVPYPPDAHNRITIKLTDPTVALPVSLLQCMNNLEFRYLQRFDSWQTNTADLALNREEMMELDDVAPSNSNSPQETTPKTPPQSSHQQAWLHKRGKYSQHNPPSPQQNQNQQENTDDKKMEELAKRYKRQR